MTCPECESDNMRVLDNWLTCIDCGTVDNNEYRPTWVHSYNCPQLPRRRQYYSRCKRFLQYVREMKSDVLGNAMEAILTLYSSVEFFWLLRVTERKYFFSRKVILAYIVKRLGLGISVPVLKDVERTTEQMKAIAALVVEGQEFGALE